MYLATLFLAECSQPRQSHSHFCFNISEQHLQQSSANHIGSFTLAGVADLIRTVQGVLATSAPLSPPTTLSPRLPKLCPLMTMLLRLLRANPAIVASGTNAGTLCESPQPAHLTDVLYVNPYSPSFLKLKCIYAHLQHRKTEGMQSAMCSLPTLSSTTCSPLFLLALHTALSLV